MAIKEKVLRTLEARRGEQVSGEKLAETLGVSRAAIHKAVESLRADGLSISAVTGGGYRLALDDDSLTVPAVTSLLKTAAFGRDLLILPTVGSTNTEIKETYTSRPHGFTLLAEAQTGGRGRLGRSFSSPAGTGIYLSVLLHPSFPLAQLSFVTLAAALAVTEAITATAGFEPGIKWVNDILMRGRKLCGILTEAVIEGESGLVSAVIVGVGINLRPNPHWPEEVRKVAGALSDFGRVPRRAALAAAFLNRFEKDYALLEENNTASLLRAYRRRLCCLNRPIIVHSPKGAYPAVCIDLTEEGHLLVRTEDGQTRELHSGEISIRLPKRKPG